MDLLGFDGLSGIRWTLPSVVSAVCLRKTVLKYKLIKVRLNLNVPWTTTMELAKIRKFRHPKSGSP